MKIIYAWARDAPPLKLPNGVGFKVGSDSPIKYIVLQVHYAVVDKFKGKEIIHKFSKILKTVGRNSLQN